MTQTLDGITEEEWNSLSPEAQKFVLEFRKQVERTCARLDKIYGMLNENMGSLNYLIKHLSQPNSVNKPQNRYRIDYKN